MARIIAQSSLLLSRQREDVKQLSFRSPAIRKQFLVSIGVGIATSLFKLYFFRVIGYPVVPFTHPRKKIETYPIRLTHINTESGIDYCFIGNTNICITV